MTRRLDRETVTDQSRGSQLPSSLSRRLDTNEITFSQECYRIFEFEQDALVPLELIGSRVHPEDIPLFSEKIAGARGGGGDPDYEIRVLMSGSLDQVPAHDLSQGPTQGWSTGVYRRG